MWPRVKETQRSRSQPSGRRRNAKNRLNLWGDDVSEQITKALVSFWSHPTDTATQYFVCSGVFVKPGWVLTVKHAFDNAVDLLYVRPNTGDLQAYPVQGPQSLHTELDAALVRIEVPPTGTTCLELDYRTENGVGPGQLQLFGFFEGRLEKELDTKVLNFDAHRRYYVSGSKHPVGHSGSPLCMGSKVWAMAYAHYLDGNTHRGCFISAAQLREWLEQALPVEGTAAKAATASASLSERLNALRVALVNAFAQLKLEPGSGLKLHEGLPLALHQALEDGNEKTGEACLDALRGVLEQLNDEVSAGQLGFGAGGREKFRGAIQVALAAAGRACQDLSCVQQAGDAHLIPADFREGATLAVRDAPHKSWVSGQRWGLPALLDKHVFELPQEVGEGEYAKDEIARGLYVNLSPTGQSPSSMTGELRKHLQGLARVEAAKGQQRFLVLRSEDAQQVNPALRSWLKEMNLGLLELQGDDGRLFWFAEPELLATLNDLWQTLNNPPWHTP